MNLAEARPIFRGSGWLAHVPADFADAVLALCRWRAVPAGQGIQHAGDGGGSVYGIASGTLSMTTGMTVPDAPITAIAHPGDWFGYIPMFGGGERAVTVEARSDVVLAVVSEAHLATLFDAPGGWRHAGMLSIVSYGHVAANIAGDLMIRDSRRRCIAALLRLANCRFADHPVGGAVEAVLSQSELGAIANLSRTTVNALLGDLESEGLIRLSYRSVILNDTAVLRRIVDEG
ncbi:MAG: hypothetical protein CFE37_08660 [Alphaproteobacteria bacterium PA4]|nr:MAG: hypothetical protein CFE37_08660 [Alphaproteobacteria bacterium PA4]